MVIELLFLVIQFIFILMLLISMASVIILIFAIICMGWWELVIEPLWNKIRHE